MKKVIAFTAIIMMATSAHALTRFLTSQWYENGNQMCKYDDGTVLNMGIKLCPLSLE